MLVLLVFFCFFVSICFFISPIVLVRGSVCCQNASVIVAFDFVCLCLPVCLFCLFDFLFCVVFVDLFFCFFNFCCLTICFFFSRLLLVRFAVKMSVCFVLLVCLLFCVSVALAFLIFFLLLDCLFLFVFGSHD